LRCRIPHECDENNKVIWYEGICVTVNITLKQVRKGTKVTLYKMNAKLDL